MIIDYDYDELDYVGRILIILEDLMYSPVDLNYIHDHDGP